MWSLLYCCVILAIANPLWVQALPTNITSETIATNHTDSESPLKCPENEFYNHSAIDCNITCDRPVPTDRCKEVKIPSCQCIDGFVRNKTGKCVNMIECLDNVPFNIHSDPLESTFHKTVINEFIPSINEIGTTNKPKNTFLPPYDFSEYEDLLNDTQSQAKYVMLFLQVNELKIIHETLEYPDIIALFQAALQSEIRNRKLAQNADYYGGNDLY